MDNVVDPKRRPKSRRDLLADATERGQPMPLVVMLDNLHFWVKEADRLEASVDPSDRPLARIARHNAQRVAVDCAQFCHPKLTTQVIAGDEENPLTIEHQHTMRLTPDDLKGKSIVELNEMYLALAKGDHHRLAALVPSLAEDTDE